MNSFDSLVNNNLGWVHENKYVFPVVSLILGMYAALARPKLPKFIEKLFNNPIFRLAMISYIIYRGNKDPQLAVMIAAAFLITMHMINKRQVKKLEKMALPGPAGLGAGRVQSGTGSGTVSGSRPGQGPTPGSGTVSGSRPGQGPTPGSQPSMGQRPGSAPGATSPPATNPVIARLTTGNTR